MAGSNSGYSGRGYAGLPLMQQQPDSAPNYVALSSAALETLPTQPIIDDKYWRSDDPEDFHRRFATGPYYLPGEPRTGYPSAPTSNASSSMAVAINQSQYSSSLYTGTPSLAGSLATASSGPSVRTSSGSSALSRYQANGMLEEGDDGVLTRPTAGTWQCPYGSLGCNERLDSIEDWERHSQSHFLRVENLPKFVECPFYGCRWARQDDSARQAWSYRWMHISTHHSGGGSVDTMRRPHSALIDHLWRIDVIDSAGKKELKTMGYLTNNDVYLQSANSSRDRRRERRVGAGRDPHGYPVFNR